MAKLRFDLFGAIGKELIDHLLRVGLGKRRHDVAERTDGIRSNGSASVLESHVENKIKYAIRQVVGNNVHGGSYRFEESL